jgi:hypothetical protein
VRFLCGLEVISDSFWIVGHQYFLDGFFTTAEDSHPVILIDQLPAFLECKDILASA